MPYSRCFEDIERERRSFTEFAASVYGRFSAEFHSHRTAVRDLAAYLEIEGNAGRDNASAYAGRIMDQNPQIVLFGLIRERLHGLMPRTESEAAPDIDAIRAVREFGGAIHLTVFAEAKGVRREHFLDSATLSALREVVRRARVSHGIAASRVLAREGGGHVRLLVQRVAEDGREGFVLAVCKVPDVPAGGRERWFVVLREAGRPGDRPSGILPDGTAPKPAPFAGTVFPTLRFRREIEGSRPASVLEIEQPLEWVSFDGRRLGALSGAAGFFLWVFAAQERVLHRHERRTREEGDRLFRMANFDTLTGLPNRRLFHNRLDRALAAARRTGQQHALLYLDLDGFKQVNDFFGHEIGDKVLQRAARIFLNRVRETDTVARLGGDEFVILLYGVAGRHGAERVAGEIKRAFSRPPDGTDHLGKPWPVLGTSVGIAVYPEDGKTPVDLLRAADRSMYRDKADGRQPPRPDPMTIAG